MNDEQRFLPPILAEKEYGSPSLFAPENLLREARRQKRLPVGTAPEICILDPDGDIVASLCRSEAARQSLSWACYHTRLYEFELASRSLGIVGCAVGAPFSVLVAEQLFASGCQFLISVSSAGQISPVRAAPYFVVIERALRDEGTSYHYAAPGAYADADARLLERALAALTRSGLAVLRGTSWTTDAPFRETARAIESARARDILCVEMEAAALYTFGAVRQRAVLCFAHVTNSMGQASRDFEKGEADGSSEALRIIGAVTEILPGCR